MRRRVVPFLVVTLAGLLALSLIRGQERAGLPAAPPGAGPYPASQAAAEREPVPRPPARDLSKFTDLQKQMFLSAQRGADWLYRMNGVTGRFLYGHIPALNVALEGDHFLRQAGAAFALARAARFTGEDRYTARATQAVLVLLAETALDPRDPTVRYITLPPAAVNRLGAAGLLVLAINELPGVQPDLLEKSEQLCNYIRRQARPDGALAYAEGGADGKGTAADPDGVNHHPGAALYGLARSQEHRPAPWKLAVLRRAAAYYRPWWRDHKSLAFIPWQSAAYTEAYLRGKEAAFAGCVTEMNDWLCGLQYAQIDPRHQWWYGGFMGWEGGRPLESPPDVGAAAYAESLAEACRVARAAGDLPRHTRYSEALVRCLQFLSTLQYVDGNTQHFADWYRRQLVGGFHASHQDGDLRIDYNQHAVSALVQYLEQVAR
jgi:hypothetical protein